MRQLRLLPLSTVFALTLTACGVQAAPTPPAPPTPPTDPAPPTDPTDPVPPTDPAPPTEPTAVNVALTSTPGITVIEREWDTELNYSTTDWEAVYQFYDQDLQAQGWQRVSEELSSDEYDADYIKDGLELELEVELESGYVEVEIDIDEVGGANVEYSLYELPGLTLNLYPDTALITREWDFEFEYASSDVQTIFNHYDGLLQSQGWQQVSVSEDGSDLEATYQLGAARLDLDIELEGNNEVEVEIDIDQNG